MFEKDEGRYGYSYFSGSHTFAVEEFDVHQLAAAMEDKFFSKFVGITGLFEITEQEYSKQ